MRIELLEAIFVEDFLSVCISTPQIGQGIWRIGSYIEETASGASGGRGK
jgi:hypothetical protein